MSALIATGAARPAGAQESIVFTKPPNDPAAKANSFMDQQPHHDSASMNMPAPLFNGPQASPDFDTAAFMQQPQPLSPQQLQQQLKQENERRNWGLMTPAEIFGVPTVEKIFGMPEPDADKDLTLEERYLRRERQAYEAPATNSLRAAGGAWNDQNNPFQKPGDRDKRGLDENIDAARQNRVFQSPFNQARSAQQSEAERRQNSIWQSVFSAPPVQPKDDTGHAAEMVRFRTLLDSQPALETPQSTPQTMPQTASFQSSYQTPGRQPAVPEYKAPTAYTAAANFEAQRQQEIGKPMGIAPLPPISAPPKKKDDSKPLVKPPPWLSDQPQPNAPPHWNNF
ncbi:MAG TPA: hypothetical protein VK742_04420 [Candidatus Sulfotelmatobacter sp.]|nr:hypothetical protein [Candidatus Sulfotelmatobacter sp.]